MRREIKRSRNREQTLVPRNPKARKEKRILCLRLEREEETGIGCQTVGNRVPCPQLMVVRSLGILKVAPLKRE